MRPFIWSARRTQLGAVSWQTVFRLCLLGNFGSGLLINFIWNVLIFFVQIMILSLFLKIIKKYMYIFDYIIWIMPIFSLFCNKHTFCAQSCVGNGGKKHGINRCKRVKIWAPKHSLGAKRCVGRTGWQWMQETWNQSVLARENLGAKAHNLRQKSG